MHTTYKKYHTTKLTKSYVFETTIINCNLKITSFNYNMDDKMVLLTMHATYQWWIHYMHYRTGNCIQIHSKVSYLMYVSAWLLQCKLSSFWIQAWLKMLLLFNNSWQLTGNMQWRSHVCLWIMVELQCYETPTCIH